MKKALRENKLLFYLYQIYIFLIVIPFLIIITFFVSVSIILFSLLNINFFCYFLAELWAKSNSYITPMFVNVINKKNIDKKKSYVIVANHSSQYDIFVLYGWLPVKIIWVMKAELKKIPIFGKACQKLGNIFVNRKNTEAAIKSLNEAKQKIKPGTSVVFFPEGTRSATTQMLPFKKGAFRFALEMEYDIIPISIIGTNNILPANTLKLFPGKAKLIINEPIPIKKYSEKNIEQLIEKTREIIQDNINHYKF